MPKKNGRPRIEVNWDKFETACKLLATKEEICDMLGLSDATLQRRVKEKYDTTFEGTLKRLGSFSKLSLRRNQFKLSEKNATMAIWLGKQYLGQSDERAQESENTPSLSAIAEAIRKTDGK